MEEFSNKMPNKRHMSYVFLLTEHWTVTTEQPYQAITFAMRIALCE